jgi:hypothetical protein
MSERAYILIYSLEGRASEIIKALEKQPGVVTLDHVDGSPDIIMVIEENDRVKLARLAVTLLNIIDNFTADMQCLPVDHEMSCTIV